VTGLILGVGMRRREFIAGLAGATALRPFASRAQRPQRNVPVVGVIWIGTASAQIPVRIREALLQGLRENGYTPEQTITVEDRYFGDGPGPLGNAAEELVRLGVDVIVAMGTPAAFAARRATSSIPIVAVSMADPVADGLIGSLARPGGNVTGNTFIGPELGPKRLQLLKEALPQALRFAGLRHPRVYGERTMQEMLSELEDKAHQIGVDFQVFDASRPEDFHGAFEVMAKWRADVLLLFTSPMFYVNYPRIVDLAAQQRLPTMYYFMEAVEGGGLMGYGADITDLFRLAAKHVAKILKGAKPGDLPVEQPTKFEYLINLKTAKALDVTISPTLIARADEVIE
jgi:putative tryptophan/tyrosine transport system substrate-binding protein